MTTAVVFGNNPIAYTDANGNVQETDPASFVALMVAQGNATLTPTQDFDFVWNGVDISFHSGEPFQVDPLLAAALTAANAPVI